MSEVTNVFKRFAKKDSVAAHIEEEIVDFCDYLPNLIVVDTQNVRGISPQLINNFLDNTNNIKRDLAEHSDIKEMIELCTDSMIDNGTDGCATNTYWETKNGEKIYVVAFDEQMSDKEILYTLTHEFAHFFDGKEFKKLPLKEENESETFCDVFSALRWKKYLGNDSPFEEETSEAIILYSQPSHYTQEGIAAVEELSKTKDCSKISIKDSIKLSNKITAKHSPSEEKLNKLTKAYNYVASDYKLKGECDSITISKIYDVLEEYSKDPEVTKVGNQFLNQ